VVGAVIRRLKGRPGYGYERALLDAATAFGSSVSAMRKRVATKATPEEREILTRLGAPLAMDEDYQNGSSDRMQSAASSASSGGPKAPPGPSAPPAPGSKPADLKPKIGTQAPAKPISKDQMTKAGKLAAAIATQDGVTDEKTLSTKVGQQIGSVGGSQADVGLMTGLVRAQLANQGMDIKEAEMVSERGFMDTLRGVVGRAKKPAKAAPVLTAPQVQANPKTAPTAQPKAAPALTRSVPINYAEIISKPEAQDALRNMMEVFGFTRADAAKIERTLYNKGVTSFFIGDTFSKWTTQTWNRLSARWEKFYHVTVTGQGEARKMTISVNP
jgi:hypothetical protein